MWFRRAFYWAQLVAIVVLPMWIVVARTLSSTGLGAQDVLVYLSWPILALAMIAVVGITWARKSVRSTRTLSWLDVAALSTWYVVTIAYGIFIALSSQLGAGLIGGLLVLVSIGAISLAIWQLLTAARWRVHTVMAGLDANRVGASGAAIPSGEYHATPSARGDDDVPWIDRSRR